MMEELLSQVKSLSPVKQRAVAAVVGCIVADAAAQPLQWVYNDVAMQKAISADPTKPEFLTPPGNPFYHLPCGSQSPYGDQLMVLLRSMAKCKGLNLTDFGDAYVKAFGPGSPYDIPKKDLPIKGHWQNKTMQRFPDLHAKGKTAEDIDDDMNDPACVIRTMAIALLYAGKPEYLSKAEESFLLLQSFDICCTSMTVAARLVELYILNGEDRDKDENNIQKLIKILKSTPGLDPDERSFSSLLNQVVSDKQLSVKEATLKFGQA